MEIKFFTGEKVLDLTGQKISIQDSNSRMNEKMFSKYFFPFEFTMNEEFIEAFGDYESDDYADLENTFDGFLLFENRIHEAKLVLSNVRGKKITGQIDFGFEDLPNFNKKLSELPLAKFKVPDIYTYAREICAKKYPETYFNFPRIYTSKYPPDSEVWDAFDGYYNDLKADGSEMRRNYIDDQGNIFNVNILHPTPHPLYVLQTGFQDAKLNLKGDILTDSIFQQRWLFSGTEYFTSKQQRRYEFRFTSAQYDELFEVTGPEDYCKYQKYVTIEKAGKYKIAGTLQYWRASKMFAVYQLKLNGNVILQHAEGIMKSSHLETYPVNIDINIPENSLLEIYIYTQFHENSWTHQISNLQITSDVLEDIQNSSLGEDTGVITNLNEIDLTKAVPDMTFGDYVNAFRNRYNYDVDIVGNDIYMNRLGDVEPTDVKDYRQFEVHPDLVEKTLLNKRSFQLHSPDLDNDVKQNSMYFDKDGAFLNKEPKEDTIIIESNVIIIGTGIPKANGHNTAIIKKDDSTAIQLVYYDGMEGVNNNCKNPPGADYPELFYSHWEKWLRQRIKGREYKWRHQANAELFSILIKDHIFCYKNIHNIKSWTKDYFYNPQSKNGVYEIDIVTETI